MLTDFNTPLGDCIGKVAKQVVGYLRLVERRCRDGLDCACEFVGCTPASGQQLDFDRADPVVDDQARLAGYPVGVGPEDVAAVQSQSSPPPYVTGGCAGEV
jgi:hypothetical protein